MSDETNNKSSHCILYLLRDKLLQILVDNNKYKTDKSLPTNIYDNILQINKDIIYYFTMYIKIHFQEVLLPILFHLIQYTNGEDYPACQVEELSSCKGLNRECKPSINNRRLCLCKDNYDIIKGESQDGFVCVAATTVPIPASTSTALILFISLLFILLIGGGLFLVARRYRLIQYLRHQYNSRRNNEVLYEDVMIGQDDPPIVP